VTLRLARCCAVSCLVRFAEVDNSLLQCCIFFGATLLWEVGGSGVVSTGMLQPLSRSQGISIRSQQDKSKRDICNRTSNARVSM
jgi:hypothetical protein